MSWPRPSHTPSMGLLGAVICAATGCTARELAEDYDVEIDSIELWQHGAEVPLVAAREAETARVWIDPAPFDLRFAGCRLQTTTTFAEDISRGFVGRADEDAGANPADDFATFSLGSVVALEPDTHWLWHNPSDRHAYNWRVTLLDQRTGAEPLEDRPGWCSFRIEGLRIGDDRDYEALETIETDGDALVVSAWNDTDSDGWESPGELVHISIEL